MLHKACEIMGKTKNLSEIHFLVSKANELRDSKDERVKDLLFKLEQRLLVARIWNTERDETLNKYREEVRKVIAFWE